VERRSHTARAEHDHRRAEDRFREEHHDAHATTIVGTPADEVRSGPRPSPYRETTSTVIASTTPTQLLADFHAFFSVRRRIRLRIVKNIPAPLMDGFAVGGYRVDFTYDVDSRTGNYLIVAGYATRVESEAPGLFVQRQHDAD
jgi:hypothetical protein